MDKRKYAAWAAGLPPTHPKLDLTNTVGKQYITLLPDIQEKIMADAKAFEEWVNTLTASPTEKAAAVAWAYAHLPTPHLTDILSRYDKETPST